MKILVIRFSSIGDIVLASPVLRCLKKQLPHAEIHLLTRASMQAVTEYNPYIHRFHYFSGDLAAVINQLVGERFDWVIDLHRNFRSFRVTQALPSRVLPFRKETLRKFLLTRFHIDRMLKRHITQRSLDAVDVLGVKDDGLGLDYFISPADALAFQQLPEGFQRNYVALVIGGSYYTKKLPVEKLRGLCTLLPGPIVLLGGPEDEKEGALVAETTPSRIFNACGKFSLNQSAGLVKSARLVISHDTGLLYIACAFQVPTIAVWGGTSPSLDVEPYYGSAVADPPYFNAIVPGLNCQPCSNYGLSKCPRGHFKCMREQDIEEIAQKAKILIETGSSSPLTTLHSPL